MPHAGNERRHDSVLPALSAAPTAAVPGSPEKIRILTDRAAKRQELFVDGDRADDEARLRGLVAATRHMLGVNDEDDATPSTRECPIGQKFPIMLKKICREQSWSMKTLVRRSGVSKRHLYHLLSGERMPTLRVLVLLADALEVSLDELVGRRV